MQNIFHCSYIKLRQVKSKIQKKKKNKNTCIMSSCLWSLGGWTAAQRRYYVLLYGKTMQQQLLQQNGLFSSFTMMPGVTNMCCFVSNKFFYFQHLYKKSTFSLDSFRNFPNLDQHQWNILSLDTCISGVQGNVIFISGSKIKLHFSQ